MAFVGRKAQLGQIRAAVQRGENVLVLGRPGIGKTALLRHFARLSGGLYWREPNSLRPLLLRICKKLGIQTRGLTMSELLDAVESKGSQPILKHGMPLVIIIDDLHDASKKASKTLTELSGYPCITLVAAAENQLKAHLEWVFDSKVRLPPLSRKDAKKLLGKAYSEAVYRDSKGMPLALLSGGYHPCVLSSRIDLLPINLLAPIAYLFLSMRYLALIEDQHSFYLLFGLFGFLMLSMNRARRVWK
jgi:replication-associated recombination protein RarA